MADKRITTELVVKAVDRYSARIKDMSAVTGQFSQKVRADMGRLQDMRGPLRLIEDFRKQQQVVRSSGEALAQARERVRQLQHTITTTREPTAQMRREFERARAAAARLDEKHQQNRRTLGGLQSQLRSAGVNTGDLAGEQRRLATALGSANTAFSAQMERMQRLQVMQDKIAASRERMDRSLARSANMSFVGNASAATGRRMLSGMSAPVMQSMDFETSMSSVRKVVDFESPAAFQKMSDDILELSTRIPMAATGLAEIVAAGGQSGIANENLTRFAEMAAKIGVAFDVSAEHSGSSMAKIKTALGLTIDETGLLFDAMNHLSNKMASTAPKVLDFTTRVAADGKVKGFNATETLAFGSAMIAAGAQADVAATSFRNMGRALVRGEASTANQRKAFQSLGLDVRGVASAMQEDAAGTTVDVMERINQLPAELRSSTMTQIFGDEARALAPLIGNLDVLKESLGLVAVQQNYAGSAGKEYEERAKTTANNAQLLRNETRRLGVTIGAVVLPALNDLIARSRVIVSRIVNWSQEHPKLTKWLVYSGVAMGGLAIAGGVMLTAAAGLIGTLAVLRFGLVGLGARAMFARGGLSALAGRFTALRNMPRLQWSSLIKPLSWAGRGALRFIPVIGWASLAGMLAWRYIIKPLGWDKYLPSIDWSVLFSAFSWEDGIPVIDWSTFISAFSWGEKIPGFEWSSVIKKFAWNAVLAPTRISDFIAKFMWRNVIEPLKLDQYIPKIPWKDYLPTWSWDFIPSFDLGSVLKWPKPPKWFGKIFGSGGVNDGSAPLQERAGGGSFGPGPLLVGERGPELYFPNRGGFIATHRQTQQLHSSAQRLRGASMAALAGVAISASVPLAAAPAGGSDRPLSTRVEIGSIHITAPSGVSDPEGLVSLLEERLGDRLSATMNASFSD